MNNLIQNKINQLNELREKISLSSNQTFEKIHSMSLIDDHTSTPYIIDLSSPVEEKAWLEMADEILAMYE